MMRLQDMLIIIDYIFLCFDDFNFPAITDAIAAITA